MKVSEWLAKLDSHTIYDAEKCAEDFTKETGLKPCWPVWSSTAIINKIKSRGLGGTLRGTASAVVGHEIAEALAERLAKNTQFATFHGRGTRFSVALESLRQAGL